MFAKRFAPLKQPIVEKGHINDDLGSLMLDMRKEALGSFDKNASRYHQGVYQKKREEMLTKLNIQLNVLFVGQLKNLHKRAVTTFDEQLKAELKKPNYNFAESVEGCLTHARSQFETSAKAILLSETDWSIVHEQETLEDEFAEASAKARADEFKKMTKALSVSSFCSIFGRDKTLIYSIETS